MICVLTRTHKSLCKHNIYTAYIQNSIICVYKHRNVFELEMEAAAPTVFMVWLRDCCQPKFFIACFYFCQVSFCSTPEPFEDQTYCILRIKIQFIPHTIQCNSYRLVDGSVRMNSLFIARVIRSYGYEKSKSQERLAFTSSSTQNLRSNTVP